MRLLRSDVEAHFTLVYPTSDESAMPATTLSLKDNKTIKILKDAEERGYGVVASIV